MGVYRKRILDRRALLTERSLFLLGPRQTGNSSYVREESQDIPVLTYNQRDTSLRLRLTEYPTYMQQEIVAKDPRDCVVFIDEIQKCSFSPYTKTVKRKPIETAKFYFFDLSIVNRYILVCREMQQRMIGGIHITPWQDFLESLWTDEFTQDLEDV